MNGYNQGPRFGLQVLAVAFLLAVGFVAFVVVLGSLMGCASYAKRVTHTSVTPRGVTNTIETVERFTDLGTGMRAFWVGSNTVWSTHEQIPETIRAAGGAVSDGMAAYGSMGLSKVVKPTGTNAP